MELAVRIRLLASDPSLTLRGSTSVDLGMSAFGRFNYRAPYDDLGEAEPIYLLGSIFFERSGNNVSSAVQDSAF
jgi:hypothetical protein